MRPRGRILSRNAKRAASERTPAERADLEIQARLPRDKAEAGRGGSVSVTENAQTLPFLRREHHGAGTGGGWLAAN